MRLRVLLPTRLLLDQEVEKVVAEAPNGSFCLEPRHIDFAACLVPGLLAYVRTGGSEQFLATDAGVLVKAGALVTVAVRDAVAGAALGGMRKVVEERYRAVDARERKARSAVERIESEFLRWFARLDAFQRR